MAGGSAAVAALAGSLRDPHPLNMVAAMIKAAMQLNRAARAMRGIQEYTQNPPKWRYYGTASMRNRTSEMGASCVGCRFLARSVSDPPQPTRLRRRTLRRQEILDNGSILQ